MWEEVARPNYITIPVGYRIVKTFKTYFYGKV